MATGITYALVDEEKISFETFVLRCARHFGAGTSQRDGDVDAPPAYPSRDSIECAKRRLFEARTALIVAEAITDEELLTQIRERRADYEQANAEFVKRHAFERDRFSEMLMRARDWQPPSPDHERLKAFMIDQLQSSLDDIADPPFQFVLPSEDVAAWRARMLRNAEQGLARALEDEATANKEFGEHWLWIDRLYKSLGVTFEEVNDDYLARALVATLKAQGLAQDAERDEKNTST